MRVPPHALGLRLLMGKGDGWPDRRVGGIDRGPIGGLEKGDLALHV